MRGDDRLPARRVLPVQAGQGPDDGQVGQPGDVLAHGGEVDVSQAGQAAVVKADHGDLARDGHPGPQEHVENPGRALVVEGQHGGDPGRGGPPGMRDGAAVLVG